MTARQKRELYRRLLSGERLRITRVRRGTHALEAVSDKSRIIGSPAFRRLAGKAQVFSLARSGSVRTRLTHSIEVSNYGELIAESIADKLVRTKRLNVEHRLAFIQTVENACLMHDIGNPPFGHMGEYAISQWFRENRGDLSKHWVELGRMTLSEAERYLAAFEQFDGNPQGLRIVTRLQWHADEHGLNLTSSLLAAYTKYLGETSETTSRLRKKIGYFPSEQRAIEQVWRNLGLRTRADGSPDQRHPLAFVMEAADDIAFCLSDIEDALERGVVSESELLERLRGPLKKYVRDAEGRAKTTRSLMAQNSTYHLIRLAISSDLVKAAVDSYESHEELILAGTMLSSLLSTNKAAQRTLGALRIIAEEFVYTSREVVEPELGGLAALKALLNAFKPMLLLDTQAFEMLGDPERSDRFRAQPINVLLRSLLPPRQMLAYLWQTKKEPKLEPVHRTQLVVDYISGMTDEYALRIVDMIGGTVRAGAT